MRKHTFGNIVVPLFTHMTEKLAKCKVAPKLYYSTSVDNAVGCIEQANQIGITHVVLLSSEDISSHFTGHFQITQSSIEDGVLLPKLPILHENMSLGIQKGNVWVISNDPSLTAAIFISFMMTSLYKNLSFQRAKKIVFKRISGSSEYDEQLLIWHKMGARIDTKNIDWLNYQKSKNVSHEDILLGLMAQTSKKTTRYVQNPNKRAASMTDILTIKKSGENETCPKSKIDALAKKWKCKQKKQNFMVSVFINYSFSK